MKAKKAQKGLTWILAGGATLSIGFLGFAGMFLISPSLFLCGGAFILAAAFEGEVYKESIGKAFKRIFDTDYLKIRIIQQFLKEQAKKNQNLFLLEYNKQKKYIEQINEFILSLEKHSGRKTSQEQKEIDDAVSQAKRKKKKAKEIANKMEYFVLQQLEKPATESEDPMKKSVEEILSQERKNVLTQIRHKALAIRISWISAIAGGVCSGFATLNAIHIGLSVLGISSVIPGGILVGLSVFSAIGYTFLLYQAFSDMVQKYKGKIGEYFEKKKNESQTKHITRCILTGIAIGLAIFTTIATAGTWWYAAKNGALMLSIPNTIASWVRNLSVAFMVTLTAVFGITNSVATIKRICKSQYGEFIPHFKKHIQETWEADEKSRARFYNPFRFLSTVIEYVIKPSLFLGHLASMGVTADGLNKVPPVACATLNAAGEGLEDLNYLPHAKKGKERESTLLTLLYFFPVTLPCKILNTGAFLWDLAITWNWTKSINRIFYPETNKNDDRLREPTQPKLSKKWDKPEKPLIPITNSSPKLSSHTHSLWNNRQLSRSLSCTDEKSIPLKIRKFS